MNPKCPMCGGKTRKYPLPLEYQSQGPEYYCPSCDRPMTFKKLSKFNACEVASYGGDPTL